MYNYRSKSEVIELESGKISKQRDMHLDLIRVVAMFFVISLHMKWGFHVSTFWNAFFRSIFFTANGLFFFISGRYAFRFKEDENNPLSSYKTFYWKKFCSLIMPLVFYSTFIIANYVYWDPEKHIFDQDPIEFIMMLFWRVFPTSTKGYIWFIYCLVGFMMTVPFISIMFNAISDKGLKLFFWMAVSFEFVSIVFFSYIIRTTFPFYGWPFLGWYFYFLCGYIMYRLEFFHKKKVLFIIAGLICLGITIVMIATHKESISGVLDDSPVYLFACIGVYLLLESVPVNKYVGKVLAFIADHSLAVYLIHTEMIIYVRSKMPASTPLEWAKCVLFTAFCSLFIAVPCDLLILKPLSKRLTKAPVAAKVAVVSLMLIVYLGIPVFLILKSRI